jgi:5-methylcytosine-specific restriction enzyme A
MSQTNKSPQTRFRVGRRPGRLRLTGRQLNEEWKVGARHALFSRDGCWYNNLERFPGALFDPHGYVLFRTDEEYRKNAKVRIGKETNVSGSISCLPGYIRKA